VTCFDRNVPGHDLITAITDVKGHVIARVKHPGPGLVAQPVQPPGQEPVRHLVTVVRLRPSRAATAMLGPPSVQAKTIRARSASP
jgi:hypothetical protein